MSERVKVYLFKAWVLEFCGCSGAHLLETRSHAVLGGLENLVVDFG